MRGILQPAKCRCCGHRTMVHRYIPADPPGLGHTGEFRKSIALRTCVTCDAPPPHPNPHPVPDDPRRRGR